ncbi:MAG: elongation factor P [Candidatus Magasanikbacteria bacterium RIFCSPHIGHO2_02_FULL_41_13]|uniref:Elongation factor P n=1 Tax=Candidatus Magasanikbacteria bacterium RIFCSPHIGHO2_02_FULL_41_13 TaxID=1798676 RepID=A0A1F6M3T7_9BACT|nr:MAG: elongation factor P [Candidatus Magasanikbacteria bacterium RIFCSPHIGHO2_02_FULL_41_13]
MGDTTDIKKGAIIRHNNDLYVVTFCQFVNPGKGSAFTKTKMKSISNGKGTENTYKSGESVDVVQVNYQNVQYLYNNGTFYSFMNKDTYETIDVNADTIGDDAKYLKEGLEVVLAMYEGNAVAMQLPIKIQYTVKEAPPAVRGDSSSGNVTKEIVLENDLRVAAPIFIKEGEEILVNTETGEYGGRVNDK